MSEEFKNRYAAMQQDLNASETLMQHTFAAAFPEKKPRRVLRLRTAAWAAAAFMLLIVIALPVMASTDAGLNLLYKLYPSVAKIITGNKTDESESILLTAESVSVHDNTFELEFSLKDLTGNRIDENTVLLDNYTLRLNDYDYCGSVEEDCEFLYHNTKTGKNHYRITVRRENGRAIETGSRITLTLGKFIVGRYIARGLDAGVDLTAVNTTPETVNTALHHWTAIPTDELKTRLGTDFDNTNSSYDVLTPGTSIYNIAPNVDITAAGYKDGMLRLQVCYSGVMGLKERHSAHFAKGVVYLAEKNDPDSQFPYTLTATYFNEEETLLYEEFFFDIPTEELENYNLAYWILPYEDIIDGNWQVTVLTEDIN